MNTPITVKHIIAPNMIKGMTSFKPSFTDIKPVITVIVIKNDKIAIF